MRNAYGYWKNLDNVKKEIEPIIDRLGRFPRAEELKEINHALLKGILTHHGGLRNLRDLLGYQDNRNARGYWCVFANAKREYERLGSKLGRIPSATDLREHLPGLLSAISRHYGGLQLFRQRIGCNVESLKMPSGYWKDYSNVETQLRQFINEHGDFPTRADLFRLGLSSLATAIERYHGGFRAVRECMGFKNTIKPENYWKDIENVKRHIEGIRERLGHFPSWADLLHLGEHSLAVSINRYHGGFTELKKAMDVDPHTSNLEERVKQILDELLDDMEYIDNARKELERFGIVLRNPVSGHHLELDRYYYNRKLAVEVQGQQHYLPIFGEDELRRTQDADAYKRRALKEQGIILIEIRYDEATEQHVRQKLQAVGVLKSKSQAA